MSSTLRRFALVALACLALAAGPCSRINQTNFDKVNNGMTYDEVVSILGKPTDSKSVGVGPLSATTAEWVDAEAEISIQFLNGKVQLKSFSATPAQEP